MTERYLGCIPVQEISQAPLLYEWDFWDPYELLGQPNESAIKVLEGLSDRAQIAFAIGCAEWVVARLSKHLSNIKAYDYLEACWAFQMDKSIAAPVAPQEDEWTGIVLAPIDLAIVTVLNTYYTTEDGQGASESAFSELIPLWVLTDKTPFITWKNHVTQRLTSYFPRQDNDHWGDPVPREVLDTSITLNPELFHQQVENYLGDVDRIRNPLIRAFVGDNSAP